MERRHQVDEQVGVAVVNIELTAEDLRIHIEELAQIRLPNGARVRVIKYDRIVAETPYMKQEFNIRYLQDEYALVAGPYALIYDWKPEEASTNGP